MTIGKTINGNHIQGFREDITEAKKQSKEAFFEWFNAGKTVDETFIRGCWDFSFHIASPMAGYVKNPQEKTVLEIGHGGARILASASRHFGKAIGIDIHDENSLVLEELESRFIKNVQLLKGDGREIPLDNECVDAVYSFIVLQHVEKIKIFKKYIAESFRVLKPGGVAVLYFGRYYKFSINKQTHLLYLLDRVLEKLYLRSGYVELSARVNNTNLKVSVDYAQRLAERIGFRVEKTLVSRKSVPDGAFMYGGQNGLVLIKPSNTTG